MYTNLREQSNSRRERPAPAYGSVDDRINGFDAPPDDAGPSFPGLHENRTGANRRVFGSTRLTSERDVLDGTGTTMIVAETTAANGPATVRGLDPHRSPYLGPKGRFGGFHHRGAVILFADGSVRPLRESIAPKTFEALATTAGANPSRPVGPASNPPLETPPKTRLVPSPPRNQTDTSWVRPPFPSDRPSCA